MYTVENEIDDCFVWPLTEIFDGGEALEGWNIRETAEEFDCCFHDQEWMEIFHQRMKPIYWRLLSGDYIESSDFSDVCYRVSSWMCAYNELDKLVGEHNIMELLDSAYCRTGYLYSFFQLLRCIMGQSYRPYIKLWPEDEIDKEIEKLEVSGDSKRGAMLCVLSAYLMIEHADLPEKHKDFLEKQLGENWSYLTNVYSFMVRRIVGSNFKAFVQIINNVVVARSFHPYVHIFYKAVLLRKDELFVTPKSREKLAKHMARLEEILKTTPQKDDLDELCNIIFGADFEEIMKNRFMSYDELNEKVILLQDSVGKLSSDMEKVTKQFAEAVESRVPVDLVETQLLRLDSSTASAIFGNLSLLLAKDPAWAKIQPGLSEKIMQKFKQQTPIVNCGAYYGEGAMHEDHSSQVYLAPESNASNKIMLDSKTNRQ